MTNLIPAFASIAVSLVYCAYAQMRQRELERQRLLRQRVAQMLWAAAERAA
ncbi:MAG: hypothetical protein SNJ82_07390 [Gemmataceae bacterium]